MSGRQTRSKTKTDVLSKAAPPSNSKGKQATRIGGGGNVKEIKNFLQQQMPGASSKEIGAMARSIASGKKASDVKQRLDDIRSRNVELLQQEGNKDGEEDEEAEEVEEDEEMESDEDEEIDELIDQDEQEQEEEQNTNRDPKPVAQSPALTRPRPRQLYKRKFSEMSDRETSIGEPSGSIQQREKKKQKTRQSSMSTWVELREVEAGPSDHDVASSAGKQKTAPMRNGKSSYKASEVAGNGSSEEELLVELEREQKDKGKTAKKVTVKKEAMEQTLEGALVPVSKDQLGQEPMKSFMLRAQHQLRAYIALVNAWPRKQGNSIEKREAPQEVIEQTLHMYPMYQTKEFLVVFNKVWGDLNVRDVMIKQVYKAAAQLRQEVKQKAKRAVEKAFLTFSLPQGQSGPSSTNASRVTEFRRIKEARIKFVRENDLFHHGNVQMPDPNVDPSLWVADTRAPFHGEVIADVAAHQWWIGANPEALRKENAERFNINKVPLSSNLIALVCSAILVALDEAAKGHLTVNFDEKTYAPLHDEFKATIDELRASADPRNEELYDEGCARFCKSMNDTLTNHIRVIAGIAPAQDEAQQGSSKDSKVASVRARIKALWGQEEGGSGSTAGPSQ
ncbi:hypothetical protein FOMPIDRAFT_1056401 [Fomitopsis schrenkii]|uniref:DUF6532 domain-containing protein n=1 Tax=Fomitopsis schrenkii TaxID=2126942 RepID=S8DHF2_FOMSC|nr:hypothetical protein FOMPIDRAFT_1056401 [Fomitopsis schrenkii]